MSYPSRKSAEAAAERLEVYAIEEKLKGNPDIGTIPTSVVERSPGDWSVKVSYLFKVKHPTGSSLASHRQ